MLEVSLRGGVGRLRIDVELDTAGGTLVLVGPNGAGKTGLLLMILGALEPDAGFVGVNGRVLFDSRGGVNVRLEDRELGYVPQDYALFPHLSVLENVEFVLQSRTERMKRRAVRERALSILEDMEILALAGRPTHALSGGEKQRVALARALAARPSALLLDEPLAALDVGARRDVRAFLHSYLAELALPTILVTHDARDAAELGHRVAVLEGGRISQVGAWNELRARPATPFVEELVATQPMPDARPGLPGLGHRSA
ncbi:MAG TPA: ATP-binding cassette domain-containing protein [Polyangiaceae bacterium]